MGNGNAAGETGGARSAWPGLLETAGQRLIPVLLTAGSLLGFVAFAGGVIVWTRFSAAKVPPDQAVNAVPRDELIAIGSALLLLFGFFGALALVGAFLIDRGARATAGMARALLGLFLVEAVVAILIADGLSPTETIALAELIALPVVAALWVTFVVRFVELDDDLPPRESERQGPRNYKRFLLTAEEPGKEYDRLFGPPWASSLADWAEEGHWPQPLWAVVAWLARRVAWLRLELKALEPLVVAWIGIFGACLIVGLKGSDSLLLSWLSASLGVFLVFTIWRSYAFARRLTREIKVGRDRQRSKAEEAVSREAAERRARGEEVAAGPEFRVLNERPLRLDLKGGGTLLMLASLTVAVVLPWCRLGEWWVGVSIAAAALLCAALWRIAALSARRTAWFGVAVFLSVPLFGTLTSMARNVDAPQVQPLALIRTSDGPDEAIQGLYVTEADERVYFATVATEGCTNELTPHSGRLEWVPKSEVVAMSLGPHQDVKEAAASALEMAYALTPAVESQTGTQADLVLDRREVSEGEDDDDERKDDGEATEKPSGKRPAGKRLEEATAPAAKRLEATGPAIRPNFGAGLTLTPEAASPGDVVTLRMSAPNPNDGVGGFGATRSGRTLRVGGVRAKIVKEPARRVENAEYLKTLGGTILKLDQEGPFVERTDEERFVSVAKDEASGVPTRPDLFVKLIDPRVLEIDGRRAEEESRYLELDVDRYAKDGKRPELVDSNLSVTLKLPNATLGESSSRPLEFVDPRPFGQAWHEGRIRFVVPDAPSGGVTVECSQLAGQPLLSVAHAPDARISVRVRPGSSWVTFDSTRSTDADDESISRRWTVAGLHRGNLTELSTDLPPRVDPYEVQLTTTDASGRTDVLELQLLRLPASLFRFNKAKPRRRNVLVKARRTLREAVRSDPPAAIEIDGHADDLGTARYNVGLSLRRARNVRRMLLVEAATEAGLAARVPVRTLAYGEGCPADPRSGRRPLNRRVDVFVFHRGVSMTPPAGCHPRRFESSEWVLHPVPLDCAAHSDRAGGPKDSGAREERLADLLAELAGRALAVLLVGEAGGAALGEATQVACEERSE